MLRYGITKEEYRLLVAYLKGGESCIRRVMWWTTTLLEQLNTTEAEYGIAASLVKIDIRSRSYMGPLPLTLQISEKTMENILAWGRNLWAQNGKRDGLAEFYYRVLSDMELRDKEKDLLYQRIQNARSKAFPLFKWKSEIIRQLRKFEKLPADLLYKWAKQGRERNVVIPDLLRIVEQMTNRNIPYGPILVTLETMRKPMPAIPKPRPQPAPTREFFLTSLSRELKILSENFHKMDPVRLIKYIYEKHPSGALNSGHVDVNATNVKKWFKIALKQYHPDKQSERGTARNILCEEITKCLTIQYRQLN